MEIIKGLNLNKNPRMCKNNSAFFAKNIKLDENGVNILGDDGISVFENINGVISRIEYLSHSVKNSTTIFKSFCTKDEIILFLKHIDEETLNSYITILRYKLNYLVGPDIGGGDDINGAAVWYDIQVPITDKDYDLSYEYIYNNGGELIVSFCAYGGEYNKMKTINLLTFNNIWNLAKTDDDGINYLKIYSYVEENSRDLSVNESFNLNHNVPFCTCKANIISSKNIICGVYQFFIRYEISAYKESREEYTKWFPIGKELYALNIEYLTPYKHTYADSHNTQVEDFIYNNVSDKAGNSFRLLLTFDNIPKHKFDILKIQLGYVIRTENSIEGRIWKDLEVNDFYSKFLEFDDNYKLNNKIESVDNFTDFVFNLYDIKNILSKNNRLYIANYKEDKVEKLESDKVVVSYEVGSKIPQVDETVVETKKAIIEYRTPTTNGNTEVVEKILENNVNGVYTIPLVDVIEFPDYYKDKYVGNIEYVTSMRKIKDCYINIYPQDNKLGLDRVATMSSGGGLFAYIYDSNNLPAEENNPVGGIYMKLINVITNNNVTNSTRIGIVQKNTLMPTTPYNFYIHFVKKDGYYTNGYRLTHFSDDINVAINENGEAFPISPNIYDKQIGVKFSNIEVPKEYDGYFITYEKVEPLVKYLAYVIEKTVEDDNIKLIIHVPEVKLSLKHYNAIYLSVVDDGLIKSSQIKDIKYYVANGTKETFGTNDKLVITLPTTAYSQDEIKAGSIVILSDYMLPSNTSLTRVSVTMTEINISSLYTKKYKELIRLTDVIQKRNTEANDTICDFNYDSFIAHINDFVFNYSVFINTDGNVFTSSDGITVRELKENNYVRKIEYFKHSFYNLSSISLKTKPTFVISVDGNTKHASIYYSPINLIDIFELKSEYINKNNIKTYSNYVERPGTSNIFDNTIRRSDVYGDEAYQNGWKLFRANEYKTLIGKKGNIVKLVSISNNILIHKENSFYILDADNKLEAVNRNVNLAAIDLFSLDAKELIDSENGKCGLYAKNHSILSDLGYIFYSKADNKIYCYNGKLSIISQPIDYVLKNITVYDCNFAVDSSNNRIMICIETNMSPITLSFNLLANSFVSLHDFSFKNSVSNESTLFYVGERSLYVLDENKTSYGDLFVSTDSVFYSEAFSDDNNYRIIDIIYNADYERVKQLESITYIISKLGELTRNKYQADNDIQEYSGDKLLIYSDNCSTDYNDFTNISKKANNEDLSIKNSVGRFVNEGSYKYPWYAGGVWHYNYFRNVRNNKNRFDSDNLSLVYGKYIVARFLINPDIKFKLEMLNFNIN